jgi:hypothetical protein
MSLIHIARNNTVVGQFTDEDVRIGLSDGTYLASDLAWRTGQSQWKPLGEWPEFFPQAGSPPPITVEPTKSFDMPAWERRKEVGFFSALIATAKEVLMSPDTTFAHMRRTGGLGSPFFYYIIPQSVLGVLMAVLMSVMIAFVMAGAQTASHSAQEEKIMSLFGGFGAVGIGLIYLVMFAVMIPASLFLGTGILHLLLKIWGACNAPFETTFRVIAYTWGTMGIIMFPLQILGMIPCIGMIFGLASLAVSIWGLIIVIKGLSITHEASAGRVIGAVVTPVVICCCLYALIMVAVFVPAMAAGARH